jgi:hypothetical protein
VSTDAGVHETWGHNVTSVFQNAIGPFRTDGAKCSWQPTSTYSYSSSNSTTARAFQLGVVGRQPRHHLSKSSRNSLTSMVWCTTWTKCCSSFQHASFTEVWCSSEEVVQQVAGGHTVMSNVQSLLCSSSLPRKPCLLSPNHHTLRISLQLIFDCSLLWKWFSRVQALQPRRMANQMRRLKSGRFQNKPSASVSNNGRLDGVSFCAQGSYFEDN